MKYIKSILLILSVSCTQKYQTYNVIDKNNFDKDKNESPITSPLRRTTKEKKEFCDGQVFFSSNAKKTTDRFANNIVRHMCPQSKYLLDTKITETWWTTIVYSRSCVEIESFCTKL
jgi:hypothetical protein